MSAPEELRSNSPVFVPPGFLRLEAIVARECGLPVEELRTPGRFQERVEARFILWYLGSTLMHYSAARMGRFYEKDHTTVLNGIAQVRASEELLERAIGIGTRNSEELRGVR